MSYRELVMSLIADITDSAIRLDIANTLYYLKAVYISGRVREDEVKNAIAEVISDVLAYKEPELMGEQKRIRVEQLVGQFMDMMRLETLTMRLFRRFRV